MPELSKPRNLSQGYMHLRAAGGEMITRLFIFVPFFTAAILCAQSPRLTFQNVPGQMALLNPGVQIDLNGDGAPDIIGLANGTVPAAFEVALSKGSGLYRPWVPYLTIDPDDVIDNVAVGDVNGDGKGDVVVATCACGDSTAQSGIEVFLGNGDGTLRNPSTKIPTPFSSFITLSDVNHDGKPDIVLIAQNQVSIMFGQGDGDFSPPVPVYTSSQYGIEDGILLTGDFDGDTNSDILIQEVYCNLGICDNRLTTLYGDGYGNFTPVSLSCAQCGNQNYVIADVNQDGKSDVVTYDRIFYGAYSRQFHQAPFPGVNGPYVPDVMAEIADFSGNGVNDIAFLTGAVGQNGTFLGYDLGLPKGGFSSPTLYPFTTLNARSLQVGDYNNDQKPDLLVNTASYSSPDAFINILLNTSVGNFSKCAPPAPVGIRVCSPTNQPNVGSLVRFDISAASFAPIRKIETWVDGHKKAETYYGWDVKAFSRPSVNITNGQHQADFFAVNYDNTKQHSSIVFTVQ